MAAIISRRRPGSSPAALYAILPPMFPPIPEVPADQTTVIEGPLRYEDVAQDGRLLLTALPHFMGLAVFGRLLSKVPSVRANARAGIHSILTRLTIEGGGGPVSVVRPVTATGGYQLAHTLDEHGAVSRLLLNTWASMTAPLGRTNFPPPPGAGQPVFVGRVLGEHVYTRPFAAREARRVTRFAPGPWPEVPDDRVAWRPPELVVALPSGARAIDAELLPDEAPIVFGLAHTDSNQHVNSLVYPRLFEEAVVRRLAARGHDPAAPARFVDVAFRKPCFAGERVRVLLSAYEVEGRVGAVGVFVGDGDAPGRPRAFARLEMG
jgi:hypothetical protein